MVRIRDRDGRKGFEKEQYNRMYHISIQTNVINNISVILTYAK